MDCSCEDIREIIHEEVNTAFSKIGHMGVKNKRRPSGYNMFVKKCLKDGRGDSIKTCAAKYKHLSDGEKEQFKEEAAKV